MALLHLGISPPCAFGKNEALLNVSQGGNILGQRRRQQQQQQQQQKHIVRVYHHITEIVQEIAEAAADGPIELPSDLEQPPLTPFQVGAGIFLTGTIAFLLFRTIQRRIRQAREVKIRSSGLQPIKDEAKKNALEKLKKLPVEEPPASALQTFYGALLAGGIAFVLYQFTVGVEGNFNSRPITSTDYTIRNISVTVRTIINGMCYLATFVFGADALGLTLYALKLAIDPPPEKQEAKAEDQKSEETISAVASSDDQQDQQ